MPDFTPKTIYSTKFLELKETVSPNGAHPWFYAHRTNSKPDRDSAVVITPVLHLGQGTYILFIETCRPPIAAQKKAKTCIELPAGLVADIDQNETELDAIKKELLEETGLLADKITINMKNCPSSSGCLSETITYARADISNETKAAAPTTDGGIIVCEHKIKLENVNSWLVQQQKEGKAIGAHTLAALYCALNNLNLN